MPTLTTVVEWDKQMFLFLNGLHAAVLDQFMFAASGTLIWLPLFIFWIYRINRLVGISSVDTGKFGFFSMKLPTQLPSLRNSGRPFAFWALLMIILAVGISISDQTASGLMKPYFKRLRPCNDPAISQFVHIVNSYCSNSYSFCSSHASNSTFIAAFFSFGIWKADRWLLATVWVWAFLHSYSRIYLGVHFPLDLLAGAAIGITTAWLLYFFIVRKFIQSI